MGNNVLKQFGRGGSASGRVTDFCPSGPGSNPGSTLGFFGQIVSTLSGPWALSSVQGFPKGALGGSLGHFWSLLTSLVARLLSNF